MKKKLVASAVLIIIIIGFGVYRLNSIKNSVGSENNTRFDLHDGSYIIDGQTVVLKNGISETESDPGSASKTTTKYFGNDVAGDFDHDKREDLAFLLTQETGGSGVFYYVVVLLNKVDGSVGTNAVFLGDRIAPQTTELKGEDILVVNYADRNSGESFAVAPSVGKSMYLELNQKTLQLGEVAQNLESKVASLKVNLSSKTWNWISTSYGDGKIIKPVKQNKFSLTFKKDNTFSAATDCNGIGGEYSVNNNNIIFTNMMSTLMYCEGSQESDFTKMLNDTQSYLFTPKGELVLTMKYDTGSILFN